MKEFSIGTTYFAQTPPNQQDTVFDSFVFDLLVDRVLHYLGTYFLKHGGGAAV